MKKLFTPLNVGAFDLDHRLVLKWPSTIEPQDVSSCLRVVPPHWFLAGGLVIHEPRVLVWPNAASSDPASLTDLEQVWRKAIGRAKSSRQSVIARLRLDLSCRWPSDAKTVGELTPRDIQVIVGQHADAARRAQSIGFDGVELDGSVGSIADLFLMPSTNSRVDRYGGQIGQRLNFVIELVESLATVFGRDRVGVLLSPFAAGISGETREDVYNKVLEAIHDQEVAYIHLELGTELSTDRLRSSPSAAALRLAYPGIFISSVQHDLGSAIDLVESRWADALGFFGPDIDSSFLAQLRQAYMNGSSAV